ncbi:MAG: hypothetical protein ACKOHK_10750 [Planctomycetia bacterium]
MRGAQAWATWAVMILGLAAGVAPPAREAVADGAAVPLARNDAGSSSRESRRRALAALPLDRIAEPQRRAIEPCLRAATLYRRLPAETVACDDELLDFALTRPEAIVDIWRVLGISRLTLDPMGPRQWRLSDGYGTVGVIRLVHQERQGRGGLLVFHGRGAYTGPLSPKNLTGSCVLLVRYTPAMPAVDGRQRQTVQIDTFLDMDGVGLEIVTRTLQPLIVRSAASNLHEICVFMSTLSDSARTNPEGVAQLASRLEQTDAADRQALATIARRAAQPAGRPQGARIDAGDVAAVNRLQTELAARWLSADELDRVQQK